MTRDQIIERFKNNSLAPSMGLTSHMSIFLRMCIDEWTRPHRFYHGLNHLSNLLDGISNLPYFTRSIEEKEKMEILALWHDVIYDPRQKDNEEASIEFIKRHNPAYAVDSCRAKMEEIFEGIRYTKYNEEKNFMNLEGFIRIFCGMDIGDSYIDWEAEKVDMSGLINREILLLKEFQFVDFPTYRTKRIEFIKGFKYFCDKDTAVDFLSNYRPKIGVYPGSFNPFHIGHLNILEQAEKIFDKVIVAVGNNPDKEIREKLWTPFTRLPFHEVVRYDGLLSDYLKTLDYADVTVIRGLRSGYDLDYEMNQLRILEDYGCKLPVIYFICSKETSHISSSMIRGLCKFPNSGAEKYIPTKYNYASPKQYSPPKKA